jgi:hypothetical protein
MSRERGQVVLVAAAVVAVALVAMLLAAVQLSYQPAPADAAGRADVSRAERTLEGAVRRGAVDAEGHVPWNRRGETAAVVEEHLRPAMAAVERSGVVSDVTYRVERNATAASTVAGRACPGGDDRVYGDCAAEGAVVLQNRVGETHLVAVVVDVRVVAADGTTRATLVVRPFE